MDLYSKPEEAEELGEQIAIALASDRLVLQGFLEHLKHHSVDALRDRLEEHFGEAEEETPTLYTLLKESNAGR